MLDAPMSSWPLLPPPAPPALSPGLPAGSWVWSSSRPVLQLQKANDGSTLELGFTAGVVPAMLVVAVTTLLSQLRQWHGCSGGGTVGW